MQPPLPRKNSAAYLSTLLGCLLMAGISHAQTKATFQVSADKADAMYRVGETVTYTIEAKTGTALAPDAELHWRMSKDGVAPFQTGTVKLSEGKAQVTGKLDEPGFLQCRVTTLPDGKGVATQWGVAVSPTELKPSMPVPDDFDAFWKEQLEALAKVPLKSQMTPVTVKGSSGKYEFFDVKVDALGAPASGYYARPAGSKPKSRPAMLILHGAGVRSADLPVVSSWVADGFLALDINAHGIENGKDAEFYKALASGDLLAYPQRERASREKSYFTSMFLRAKRALDFLCSQPEWDGRTLVVSGGSQGGFQAFAAAALDPRVTMMVAQVPAGSDHTGMMVGRVSGWPKLVPPSKENKDKPDPVILEASRYVDCVNFATRVKAESAIVSAGFVDGVCPPTSVYAAFNALPVKDKHILHGLGMGHTVSPKIRDESRKLILEHVRR